MKIEEIKTGGVYILRTRIKYQKIEEQFAVLYVRIFGIDSKLNLVEVHLIGQPKQYLFAVLPEELIKCEDIIK